VNCRCTWTHVAAAATVDGSNTWNTSANECTEQTVSRFLPNVVTYRAYKELGLAQVRPDLETSCRDWWASPAAAV